MKKVLVFAVLISLLLCGCEININIPPAATTAPAQQTQPLQPTESTEVATEPAETAAPTVEATMPVGDETVTVYLLDKTVLYDSGNTQCQYDEHYNIDSITTNNIENNLMFTKTFAQKDANGMPGKYTLLWTGESDGVENLLSWTADGKLLEAQLESYYSGLQFDYDKMGNMVQKREYYEGILQSATRYEYEGTTLIAVYGEDPEGNKLFECKVENGRVVEKLCLDAPDPYGYRYKYDGNNNLVESTFFSEGEEIPNMQYTYFAVEVTAERARFLQAQQKFLLATI